MSQDDCSICLQGLKAVLSTVCKLPCGHEFHANCIGQWMNVNPSCPMCKALAIPGLDDDPVLLKLVGTKKKIECPAPHCNCKISGKMIRLHYSSLHSRVACEFCEVLVAEDYLKEHKESECDMLPVKCPAQSCQEPMYNYQVKSIIQAQEKGEPLRIVPEEGDTDPLVFQYPFDFVVYDHRCQHAARCSGCSHYFESHHAMVEHCSEKHADIIETVLGKRKRRAAANTLRRIRRARMERQVIELD